MPDLPVRGTTLVNSFGEPIQAVRLAEWEDERVQLVYQLICDTDNWPPSEEHWEGWVARRIVAALERELEEGVAHEPASIPETFRQVLPPLFIPVDVGVEALAAIMEWTRACDENFDRLRARVTELERELEEGAAHEP